MVFFIFGAFLLHLCIVCAEKKLSVSPLTTIKALTYSDPGLVSFNELDNGDPFCQCNNFQNAQHQVGIQMVYLNGYYPSAFEPDLAVYTGCTNRFAFNEDIFVTVAGTLPEQAPLCFVAEAFFGQNSCRSDQEFFYQCFDIDQTAPETIYSMKVLGNGTSDFITVNVQYSCNYNSSYMGPRCAVFCPPPTAGQCYQCDRVTGAKVCCHNFTGADCDMNCRDRPDLCFPTTTTGTSAAIVSTVPVTQMSSTITPPLSPVTHPTFSATSTSVYLLSTAASHGNGGGGLSPAIVALIVVLIILLAVLLAVGGYCIYRKGRRDAQHAIKSPLPRPSVVYSKESLSKNLPEQNRNANIYETERDMYCKPSAPNIPAPDVEDTYLLPRHSTLLRQTSISNKSQESVYDEIDEYSRKRSIGQTTHEEYAETGNVSTANDKKPMPGSVFDSSQSQPECIGQATHEECAETGNVSTANERKPMSSPIFESSQSQPEHNEKNTTIDNTTDMVTPSDVAAISENRQADVEGENVDNVESVPVTEFNENIPHLDDTSSNNKEIANITLLDNIDTAEAVSVVPAISPYYPANSDEEASNAE